MVALSTANSTELTQEQVQRILIQPLEQRSVFLGLGVRLFDTNGSPVRVPKLGGPTTPSWVGENELIPEVNADFGEVKLLPNGMKGVKVLTRYSNELLRQSVVSLEGALRDRIVTDVASVIDSQFLGASGDGITTPKGILAWSGVQTINVGGALDLDVLLDAWGNALTADVNMSGLKWVMQPREFVGLRKLKDGDGKYMLQPDPTMDGVFRLFGAPVVVTKRMADTTGATPTARMVLADFSQVGVARDLAPTVTILRERFAEYDQQAMRIVTRYDAAPLNPEAVVKLTGITI